MDSITRTKDKFSQKDQLFPLIQSFDMEISEDVGKYNLLFHQGKLLSYELRRKTL